jgi:hypothetical protein
VAGVGLLMVLCCAGPALIAGGALVALFAVGSALVRRARRRSGQAGEDRPPHVGA